MVEEMQVSDFVVRRENANWVFYIDTVGALTLDPKRCGKWMYMTSDLERAEELVRDAVVRGIVYEAKRGTERQMAATGSTTTVCCFYLNGDDDKAHRRVIQFFLEHDLVRRTKKGRLYNISFKYDAQTLAGEYGDDFHAKICLADFVDLDTGEFLRKE